jgi:peptide deformylase
VGSAILSPMALEIVLYPDPRLRAKNTPVNHFDEQLAVVAREMFELMYGTEGVGLAAPQVGINRTMLVYNPTGDPEEADEERVLCNPKVIAKSSEVEPGEEGCLSFPEMRGSVTRPIAVEVEAFDLQGNSFRLQIDDWEARIFQHELDHLDGILFIDRFSPADKTRVKAQLGDFADEYRETLANSSRA